MDLTGHRNSTETGELAETRRNDNEWIFILAPVDGRDQPDAVGWFLTHLAPDRPV